MPFLPVCGGADEHALPVIYGVRRKARRIADIAKKGPGLGDAWPVLGCIVAGTVECMDVYEGTMVVYVESGDARLKSALVGRLRRMPDLAVAEPADGAEGERRGPVIIVSTTGDMSIARCRALHESGAYVIVLAPVVRGWERISYRDAGAAAYLAMDIDAATLQEAIAEAWHNASKREGWDGQRSAGPG